MIGTAEGLSIGDEDLSIVGFFKFSNYYKENNYSYKPPKIINVI